MLPKGIHPIVIHMFHYHDDKTDDEPVICNAEFEALTNILTLKAHGLPCLKLRLGPVPNGNDHQ